MADTQPTKVGFWRACRLCLYGAFFPSKLIKEQERDLTKRNQFQNSKEREPSAMILCRSLWYSLLLVLASGGIGYLLGMAITQVYGLPDRKNVVLLQILGALFLLWGTLFVRGWEIQTYCGVTFTERVNQWIYRGLYCIGTAIIVFSIAMS